MINLYATRRLNTILLLVLVHRQLRDPDLWHLVF